MSSPTEEIKKARNTIREFLDILDKAEKQNCCLISYVKFLDSNQNDLLHEIEFGSSFLVDEKAKELKNLRKKRREVKDTIELWHPVKEYAKKHKEAKRDLKEMLRELDKTINFHMSRTYHPRTGNSPIAGKHFDSDEEEVSKSSG